MLFVVRYVYSFALAAERFFENLLIPSFFEVLGTSQHERQDG